MKKYDLIVIGAGGGAKVAGPARHHKWKVAFIEKEAVGGTCLNRGCIPSKMIIHPANVISHANEAKKIQVTSKSSVDFKKLITRVSNTVDKDSKDSEKYYENYKTQDFYRGEAKFIDDKIIEINGEKITAPLIVIATGSRPLIPNIKGLKDTPYWTSREALRNTKLPKKLLVLGGGYIGCELSHAYGSFGSKIEIISRSGLLAREDEDIRKEFEQAFSKKFKIHTNVETQEVIYKNKQFTIKGTKNGKAFKVSGDQLLVATGVIPNSELAKDTKIKINEKGFIQVDKFMQTNVKGVYAIGDVAGNYMFRHSVNFEGEYLTKVLIDNYKKPIKYPPMPHAVFTHPEIAGVGLTEQEAKQQKKNYFSVIQKYEHSAQGMARLPEHGIVKLIVDKKTKTLLGAHILGDEASVMIHQILQGMQFNAKIQDYLDIIYIHPALPEIVRNAFRKAQLKK